MYCFYPSTNIWTCYLENQPTRGWAGERARMMRGCFFTATSARSGRCRRFLSSKSSVKYRRRTYIVSALLGSFRLVYPPDGFSRPVYYNEKLNMSLTSNPLHTSNVFDACYRGDVFYLHLFLDAFFLGRVGSSASSSSSASSPSKKLKSASPFKDWSSPSKKFLQEGGSKSTEASSENGDSKTTGATACLLTYEVTDRTHAGKKKWSMMETKSGKTLLHYACMGTQLRAGKYLIKKTAPIAVCTENSAAEAHGDDFRGMETSDRNSVVDGGKDGPKSVACEVAEIDVNRQDHAGFTALHYAVRSGSAGFYLISFQEEEQY